MSYYRRGYNWEQHEYLPAPVAGWNPDAPPTELPQTEALVIDNLLIRPGKLVMRNPIDVVNDLSAYSPLNVAGYVGGDTPSSAVPWWLLGRKVPSATATVEPWNVALVQPPVGSSRWASGNTTNVWFEPGGTVTSLATTADTVPGNRWINFNGYLYGLGYDSVAAPVPASPSSAFYVKPTPLLYAQLSVSSATNPSVVSGTPLGGVDLKGYLSRVWVLAGTRSGVWYANTLYFSNPVDQLIDSTNWKDPISGLVNYITLDNNTHDFGVGLAVTRAGLMILRRSSIYLLRGTTTANFSVQALSKEVGCVDARSILEVDVGCYFVSHKGLMMANGTSVKNVSGTVTQTLQAAIAFEQQQIISGSGTGYITCGLLSDGQILVSIAYQPSSLNGIYAPIWTGMFDPAMNCWTRVTSQIWTAENALNTTGYPGMLLSRPDNRQLYSVDKKYVSQIEDLQNVGTSIVRVTPVGYAAGAFYDKSLNATPYLSIPATWVTKYGSLAMSTHKRAQANRFYLDYVFQSDSLNGPNGYEITPIDGFGSTFSIGTLSVPAVAPSSTSYVPRPPLILYGQPVLQHFNNDFVVDLENDLAFSMQWSDVAQAARPPTGIAEMYGVGVQFQPTTDRR